LFNKLIQAGAELGQAQFSYLLAHCYSGCSCTL